MYWVFRQRPFVYMGQNTKCLTSLGKGPPVSKTAELITAGVAGRPALHMVINFDMSQYFMTWRHLLCESRHSSVEFDG